MASKPPHVHGTHIVITIFPVLCQGWRSRWEWAVAPEEAKSNVGRERWQPKVLTLEAMLVLLLIGIRVLAVADYQPATALAVAQQGGTGNVALGSLIPMLPAVLPLTITFTSLIAIFWASFATYRITTYNLILLASLLIIPTLLISPGNGRFFLSILGSGLLRYW